MFEIIRNNLDRQCLGLELLASLLDEEFSLLMEHNTAEIMSIELSIHELIRQLATEKREVRTLLGGGLVRDYAAMLMDDDKAELLALWQAIDTSEQACARKASQNAELSLALLDQSKSMLNYLHKQVQPQTPTTYAKNGAYRQQRPQASLISGRL